MARLHKLRRPGYGEKMGPGWRFVWLVLYYPVSGLFRVRYRNLERFPQQGPVIVVTNQSGIARGYFTERYRQVRESMAAVLRAEYGERLPNGLTPERTAPLLVAVMDGLQYQWLLDPESVDMPGAFRDFLALLGEEA